MSIVPNMTDEEYARSLPDIDNIKRRNNHEGCIFILSRSICHDTCLIG
jgi:hypothetical protein